ncbi:hypothetical protein SLA2020_505980 [Shorea laevis]
MAFMPSCKSLRDRVSMHFPQLGTCCFQFGDPLGPNSRTKPVPLLSPVHSNRNSTENAWSNSIRLKREGPNCLNSSFDLLIKIIKDFKTKMENSNEKLLQWLRIWRKSFGKWQIRAQISKNGIED